MITSVPRPEYPRPQFVRDNWKNLNGTWEFEIDQSRSGTNEVDTIQLKIHWNATAMATAAPRMVLGNTSAMSTQQIGPHENMKLAE